MVALLDLVLNLRPLLNFLTCSPLKFSLAQPPAPAGNPLLLSLEIPTSLQDVSQGPPHLESNPKPPKARVNAVCVYNFYMVTMNSLKKEIEKVGYFTFQTQLVSFSVLSLSFCSLYRKKISCVNLG